jgi:hypothetical protein
VPKHCKLSAYRPAPAWDGLWKQFYLEIEEHAVPILHAAGFYENHDIEPSAPSARLGDEEKDALERVVTALTIAANCAHRTPPRLMAAWLKAVSRRPELFRSEGLPPEALEAIAAHYRRGTESSGEHIQDVFSSRRIRFPGRKLRPTSRNIARAAQAALASLQRPRGRPQNVANYTAAEYLASTYRFLSGRRIARHQTTVDLGFKRLVIEDGPFHEFLEAVIGPLQKHLKTYGLPTVTIETIERIVAERLR